MDEPLILASASPRRRQLLTEAGYRFEVDPSGIDEPEPIGPVAIAAYVSELAWRKAHAVATRRGRGLILAADTSCAVGDFLLNKPVDRDDAERMIRLQEGCDTEVVTGICLYRAERREWVGAVESSVVRFRVLTDEERIAYLDSGRWGRESRRVWRPGRRPVGVGRLREPVERRRPADGAIGGDSEGVSVARILNVLNSFPRSER